MLTADLGIIFTQGLSERNCFFNFYHPMNSHIGKIIMSDDFYISFKLTLFLFFFK